MAMKRKEQTSRSKSEVDSPPASSSDRGVYQSGVVDKALVDRVRRISDPDRWRVGEDPPWSIVERYLTTGEYSELIEEHARTSRAFADVLEALRNDEAERDDVPDLEPSSVPDAHEARRPREKSGRARASR